MAKDFMGRSVVETLSRSVIDLFDDEPKLFFRYLSKVYPFWKIVPQ